MHERFDVRIRRFVSDFRPGGCALLRIAAVALAFGSVVAAGSRADTIVLKNGKRIVALSVVEDGDKIRYETAAGQLSLPRSIVDHIERGPAGVMPDSPAANAAGLAIAPPAFESDAEVENATVHDGAIDRNYLSHVEGEARSGAAKANARAARALHAASQFELAHGDMEHALIDERSALNYVPDEPMILMNVAYLHLKRSEYKASMEYLERARRVAPDDPEIAKLEGWGYYGMVKLDQAVAEWKRALAIGPDPEVQAALAKAERDRREEQNYRENESIHFTLHYDGNSEPELAKEMLRALEMHFGAIESELNYTPPDSISVVLYTQQAFADITRAPSWVGALNDGRIRVPVQGLTSLTPELSRILKHELTHSFVQQRTHGRAPVWLNEGIAQWMEGKRSGENAAVLVQVYNEKQAMSLGEMEGSWMQLPTAVATYAYAWALANVEYIVQTDGIDDVQRILNSIAEGNSTEAAIQNVLHMSYEELEKETVNYLKKTYM
jgi:tetratricopeptide (TPR) repeat protein